MVSAFQFERTCVKNPSLLSNAAKLKWLEFDGCFIQFDLRLNQYCSMITALEL